MNLSPDARCCNDTTNFLLQQKCRTSWLESKQTKKREKKDKVATQNYTDKDVYTRRLLAGGDPRLPCVCVCECLSVCVVHPGAVSLQHSLIHSIFLVGGASVSKEEERWPQANDWHILLLSNWPSASLWGGPTADLTSAEEADYIHVCTHARTHTVTGNLFQTCDWRRSWGRRGPTGVTLRCSSSWCGQKPKLKHHLRLLLFFRTFSYFCDNYVYCFFSSLMSHPVDVKKKKRKSMENVQ